MTDTWIGTRQSAQKRWLTVTRWLLKAKASGGIRSLHFWIIAVVMAGLGYIYYAVLPGFHDIYIVLFFYPMIYAAVVYRLRGVLVSGIAFMGILLPYALVLTGDPYALVRSVLLAAFAFLISGLAATLLNYLEQQFEAYQEILSLNEELNGYIERLETTQKQLIQAEKLNALGQLAASIAHEINNPLAGVLIYTRLLEKKLSGGSFNKDEVVSNLAKIDTAVSYCSRIIRGLLDFARQSEPSPELVSVSDIIGQALILVEHQAEMGQVEIVREDAPGVPVVMVDPGQIQQVMVNLIVNGIQAMSGGGKLVIRSSSGSDNLVRISVQDSGCGITPQNMEKLFTPFFTTKDEVKGVGLGLAVSHGIIERHGGKIEVRSEVGKGSTFTVLLPAKKDNITSPLE